MISESQHQMFGRHPRSQVFSQGKFSIPDALVFLRTAVVFAALGGLLVARSLPPRLLEPSSTHSVTHSHSAHDQRPRFDNERSQWGIPIATFAGIPASGIPAGVCITTSFAVPFFVRGIHYTRPPPVLS